MQRTDGTRRILSSALGYSLFQELIGAAGLRRWLASNVWKISPGSKVVDFGCGPGDVLPFLPSDVEYVGFDPSAPYISQAERRFGARPRATFLRGLDRGAEIRFEEEWKALLGGVFDRYSTRITTNLIRLPYVHILMEAFNRG